MYQSINDPRLIPFCCSFIGCLFVQKGFCMDACFHGLQSKGSHMESFRVLLILMHTATQLNLVHVL